MTVINLKECFGKRYRITWDPAYKGHQDPWMMQIPCRGYSGCIYPHGGDVLVYEWESQTTQRLNMLLALGCELHQQGDEEYAVRFHVDLFDKIIHLTKPRLRRTLTQEQIDRQVETLRPYRFTRNTEAGDGPKTDSSPEDG